MSRRLALAIAITQAILIVANAAAAVLVTVRYQNPSADRAYDGVAACRADGSGDPICASLVGGGCAPGATCSGSVDLPVGTHEVTLRAFAGTESSVPSNARTLSVEAPPVDDLDALAQRFDVDDDGAVTSADFAQFLRVFGRVWRP